MIMAVSNGALRGYLDTATPLIVAAIAFVVDYNVDPKLVYPQGKAAPPTHPSSTDNNNDNDDNDTQTRTAWAPRAPPPWWRSGCRRASS